MTQMFPELIEGTLKQVKAENVILDTEALDYNPDSQEFLPFQETTKRRRKYGIAEMQKTLPLRAFVFDILYVDGKSLIDTPLKERLEIFKKTLRCDSGQAGDQILIHRIRGSISSPKNLTEILEHQTQQLLEGRVLKRWESC